MDAKNQFLNQKPLAEWWASIAGDPKFDAVLLHAAAVTLEACPDSQQRAGVLFFKEVLLTLSQKDSAGPEFAKPGLNHDLEVHRKTVETEQTK
jgi:hypothetical protein